MFNLKRKVKKKKAYNEALKCEASIFISYYFRHQLRTKINYVPRHDDGGEVPSSRNLSIFFHPR